MSMNATLLNLSITAIRFVKISQDVTSARVRRDSNLAETDTLVKVFSISL